MVIFHSYVSLPEGVIDVSADLRNLMGKQTSCFFSEMWIDLRENVE